MLHQETHLRRFETAGAMLALLTRSYTSQKSIFISVHDMSSINAKLFLAENCGAAEKRLSYHESFKHAIESIMALSTLL